jgi:hypothetical protein
MSLSTTSGEMAASPPPPTPNLPNTGQNICKHLATIVHELLVNIAVGNWRESARMPHTNSELYSQFVQHTAL